MARDEGHERESAAAAGTDFAPVRWGVLGASRFALKTMLPGLRDSRTCRVVAIASRVKERAEAAARAHEIARAYGDYQAVLDDPEVEAVYVPLPNHEHVPWSLRAAAAGKHVLCEKPIALSAREAEALLAARDRHDVLIQEAAMVRLHPRWQRVRELVANGALGRLSTAHGHFSYFNDDPDNVRNQVGIGGGGLLDIGFYPVTMSRFVFGEEPREVMARWDVDPRFGVDRTVSGVLSFSFGPVTFTAGTQTVAHQTFTIFGSDACLQVPMAWTFPDDRPSGLILERGPTPLEREVETVEIAPLHQWRNLVEAFARAVRLRIPAPLPLEDAIANMRVLDALARSCLSGRVELP